MNVTLVGAFVLGLGAVAVAIVLWLASGGAWKKQVDLYLAISDESVAGLNVNAMVKYNGVDVGTVRQIRLDPANPQRVRLLFAIERGTPIKQDTLAMLRTQGLTGIAYVELSGGVQGAPELQATAGEPYPVIQTKASLGARLENVLSGVLSKLDRTSSHIDAILSDANKTAFSAMLADSALVAHTLAGRKDSIDAGLADAARTMAHGARVGAALGPAVERVAMAADSVQRMGTEVAAAGTATSQTVASVGVDLQRLGADTVPEVQRLLAEVEQLSATVRRLSEQTERDPAGLLFGRSPAAPGPGETATPSRRP